MLLIGIHVKAQYTLMPIAPPPSFSFNDLWHFNIINSDSGGNTQFYVSIRIFDGSNVLKVKSNSGNINLSSGSNYYNLGNIALLQPFTTSYYDGSLLQQAISSGGFFPPGTYYIVYTLYGKFADGNFTPLAEDVSETTVEAMWPPMLLSPPDGDSIDTQYPLLTWTPAFSSSYTGQVTYTLRLVELFAGQNAYQAIQSNPLYFTQNNIPITMLPYPPSAQLLDTSKTYAWQVHADAMGSVMGSSEVWMFHYKNEKSTPDPVIHSVFYFTAFKNIVYDAYSIFDGNIYIQYDSEYYSGENSFLQCRLLNSKFVEQNNNEMLTQLPISMGTNRYVINQCDLKLNKNDDEPYYYIEVTNPKHEKWHLKFKPMKNYSCE